MGIPMGKLVSKGLMGAVGTSSARYDTNFEDNDDPRKPVSFAAHYNVPGYSPLHKAGNE